MTSFEPHSRVGGCPSRLVDLFKGMKTSFSGGGMPPYAATSPLTPNCYAAFPLSIAERGEENVTK